MSGQPEAIRVIADIETWWGQRLDRELIKAITSAPFSHLVAFYEEGNDLQRLYEGGHLPSLPEGSLRPIWGETMEPAAFNYRTAAKMLLYVDSVVEDSHRLEPFNIVGMEDAQRDHVYVRSEVRRDLEWLMYNRPLIEDGSILFTAKHRGLAKFGLWDQVLGRGTERSSAEWQMSGNVLAAMEGTATPIAQTADHETAYRSLLGGHTILDGRVSELSTLARIELPGLQGRTLQSVVQLRSSADEFVEWRGHLRSALSAVNLLNDTEQARAEAAAIVRDELTRSTEHLTRSMRRSPALSAFRAAGDGLTITALGAAGSAGVAALLNPSDPNLITGAVVGAVPGTVEAVRDIGKAFVEASHARRTGRAVWNILGSFDRDRRVRPRFRIG
ncbi:hypothetical protein [Agromyces allii]|uniref:Uncharacterized protein n=1 Tax=Agromyces allii TaxID=393607 RepID=A0ABN2QMA3_9MICO|nr:hypothetical protein [Agromyces allii]